MANKKQNNGITMTLQQAAVALGVQPMTLYRWRKAGKIPYVEFPSRHYRFFKEDIDAIKRGGLNNDR